MSVTLFSAPSLAVARPSAPEAAQTAQPSLNTGKTPASPESPGDPTQPADDPFESSLEAALQLIGPTPTPAPVVLPVAAESTVLAPTAPTVPQLVVTPTVDLPELLSPQTAPATNLAVPVEGQEQADAVFSLPTPAEFFTPIPDESLPVVRNPEALPVPMTLAQAVPVPVSAPVVATPSTPTTSIPTTPVPVEGEMSIPQAEILSPVRQLPTERFAGQLQQATIETAGLSAETFTRNLSVRFSMDVPAATPLPAFESTGDANPAPGSPSANPLPVFARAEISSVSLRDIPAPQTETVRVRPGEVLDQVQRGIEVRAEMTVRNGRTEFHLQLDPPELGTVHVQLTAGREGLTARLFVADDAVRQAVEAQLATLRQRMPEAFVSVTTYAPNQGDTGSRNPWQQAGRRGQSGREDVQVETSFFSVLVGETEAHVDLLA